MYICSLQVYGHNKVFGPTVFEQSLQLQYLSSEESFQSLTQRLGTTSAPQ